MRAPAPSSLHPRGIQMLGQAGDGLREWKGMLTNGAREAFCPEISVSVG